jgi:hypothetical protein
MSHSGNADRHHHVEAAGHLFRARIWLSSAMWVPVLAANLTAVALAICPPILLTEIRRYGSTAPQVVRRLHALYDRLLAVVDESERPRVALERRLLDKTVEQEFPDSEERAIIARPDRMGLGGA